MMNKFIVFIILYFLSLNSFCTSSCQLLINAPNYYQSTLGAIKFSTFNANYIWLDSSMGNKVAAFNTNQDYEVVTGAGSYYFRLNGEAYNPTGTNQTYIYDLAWAFNMVPPTAGTYVVNAYNSTQAPVYFRYLVTVGDSISWWQYGRFLRCLMRDSGLHYDFSGQFTDVFGFNHDAHGGDSTTDLMARINTIPVADAYFLLIGTNDHTNAATTADNIISIAQSLRAKSTCAKVYISTLLPRNDAYNTLNQDINTLLRNHGAICQGCVLLDLGAYFYAKPNWATYLMADGIHPNMSGENLIANYLAPLIL